MGHTLTVTEARAALPAILERVLAGEEVTLTRHGVPVAVVVRPDVLRTRRADRALGHATAVHELVARAAAAPLPATHGLTVDRADALVAELRAARSSR